MGQQGRLDGIRARSGSLLWAWIAALVCTNCVQGAPEAQTGAPGTLHLTLATENQGTRYVLAARFVITGPQSFLLESEAGEAELTHELEPGEYIVAIQPDFTLYRAAGSGALEPVDAELVSTPDQNVHIDSESSTKVAYEFRLQQTGAVTSPPGQLDIEIVVHEGGCESEPLRFERVRTRTAPINTVQIIYDTRFEHLVLRNAASAIVVMDIESGEYTTELANWQFTDMSLAPDGRYVFAADYGGENIGYGTPARQHYVHRLDLWDGSWQVQKAPIAGRIEATSDTTFVLQSLDQWVEFTHNSWGPVDIVGELASLNAFVYAGDFRYDHRTERLIHGNSGLSSQEVQAFKLGASTISFQEGTGTYGSASGHGPSIALATDGSAFYYGRLAVDALDVSRTLRVFAEPIVAATGSTAFGDGKYFDAHTGMVQATLGFDTLVYGLNAEGDDFWAYDAETASLVQFAPSACPAAAE